MLVGNKSSDKIFDFVNYTLLAIIFIVVVYPLIYVVFASISDPILVSTGKVWFYPKGITFDAYKNVFMNEEIWIGYKNSFIYALCGTAINLFCTITCAFALSRKQLKGRNFFMGIFVFTMYFSGGIVPFYILMKNLLLLNTIWAMVLPGAISVYNMIICRTYYSNNIPEELYESAKIDGASNFRMFFKIALPLSTPIIAVMALFYGVGHWNAFFNALIFITEQKLYPLQLVLRNILMLNQQLNMDLSGMDTEQIEYVAKQSMMAEAMKYSLIIVASLPVLMIYPLIQKYFVKGIMIGAIKG